MANKIYWSKTALIGGAAGALDSIDGASLVDGDFAHVTVGGVLYVYKLDDDSAAAESSPDVIAPDANAGDKRWILQTPYTKPGKILSITRQMSAASEDVAYTGVGFKPSMVDFQGVRGNVSLSSGVSDGTVHYCATHYGAVFSYNTYAVELFEDESNYQAAIIKTLDADGFTLTWTKAGSPGVATANVIVKCFR